MHRLKDPRSGRLCKSVSTSIEDINVQGPQSAVGTFLTMVDRTKKSVMSSPLESVMAILRSDVTVQPVVICIGFMYSMPLSVVY